MLSCKERAPPIVTLENDACPADIQTNHSFVANFVITDVTITCRDKYMQYSSPRLDGSNLVQYGHGWASRYLGDNRVVAAKGIFRTEKEVLFDWT